MYKHAYVFFVTADQRFGFAALMGVFALLVFIATVLSIRWKEFSVPKIVHRAIQTSNQSLQLTAGRSDVSLSDDFKIKSCSKARSRQR